MVAESPEAALPQIYDRFFRAAPTDIDGTGLGLAIAKAAGDRSGARIDISNRRDTVGVTATIEIPLDSGKIGNNTSACHRGCILTPP